MQPFLAGTITLAACFAPSIDPTKFTFSTLSIADFSAVRMLADLLSSVPALLYMMSSFPCFWTVKSTRLRTSFSSATWQAYLEMWRNLRNQNREEPENPIPPPSLEERRSTNTPAPINPEPLPSLDGNLEANVEDGYLINHVGEKVQLKWGKCIGIGPDPKEEEEEEDPEEGDLEEDPEVVPVGEQQGDAEESEEDHEENFEEEKEEEVIIIEDDSEEE